MLKYPQFDFMSSFRVRPRFRRSFQVSPEVLQNHLHKCIEQDNGFSKGQCAENYVVINIAEKERHFWSPQLSLELEAEENGTLVRGLYGPSPSVWTFFLFGYATTSVIALFLGIITFATMSLGKPMPFYAWGLPLTALVGLGIYLIGQFGQKVGAEQMYQLHHFFEDSVQDRVRLAPF
ncbi:MAG: hypothetical protein AAF740_13615 [Bacteroidota bacterium]